eukprot:59248-Rhodomonas_salina.1
MAGLPAARCLPAVFVAAAVFALGVLVQMALTVKHSPPSSSASDAAPAKLALQLAAKDHAGPVRMAQPMLRTITVIIGWTAILSNSIYGLFAPRFLGFQQQQLSATYSAAAVLAIATQLAFPRIVARIGAHLACTLGIAAAAVGIGGLALVRFQPLHSTLYLLNRAGAAVADTATATLVAGVSASKEARARNLALL